MSHQSRIENWSKTAKIAAETRPTNSQSHRIEENQNKLDAFHLQHTAAVQYTVNDLVTRDKEMTEELIEDTHAILVNGLIAEEAGVVSGTNFGST